MKAINQSKPQPEQKENVVLYQPDETISLEIIIDDEVYAFGASLKDAGKKLFAYIRMSETSATDLLSLIR